MAGDRSRATNTASKKASGKASKKSSKRRSPARKGGKRVDHEDRKQRILEAADTLFGEQGYDGTSARDIAEAADVNKALVFYYYGSMAELFAIVLERYYDAHARALKDAFDACGTVRERLHGVIDAYIDFINTNRRWPRLVQGQIASAGTHNHLIARNLAPLFQWTENALADVTFADGPLAARQFFLTIAGAVINYFTYAPVLVDVWPDDPLAECAIDDRRAHIHWLVDAVLDRLQAAKPT